MKKFLRIASVIIVLSILSCSIIFSLTACSSEEPKETTETETTITTEETTEYTETTYDIPDYYEEPNEPETIDYSDFGFENNYDMNTWIQYDDLSVDDPENAYIYVGTDYATLTFNNNTLKQERWNRTRDNKGEYYSVDNEYGGYVWHTDTYEIMDNNTIILNNYRGDASLSIIDKATGGGVVVLSCSFKTYYHENTSSGTYIPIDFIDWDRSPEESTITTVLKTGEEYERDCVKYYIKSECLY